MLEVCVVLFIIAVMFTSGCLRLPIYWMKKSCRGPSANCRLLPGLHGAMR